MANEHASRDGYHYEYDETGGYDCMTGAFWVLNPEGKVVLEIDLRHYGQQTCTEPTPEMMQAAQKVAIDVVAALNGARSESGAIPTTLHKQPPMLTGMTFGSDCIINGVLVKAGTTVRFAVPDEREGKP